MLNSPLLTWRREQGLTQAELGAALRRPVAQVTVSRWERGIDRPGPAAMADLNALTRGALTPNDFYDLPPPAAAEAEAAPAGAL